MLATLNPGLPPKFHASGSSSGRSDDQQPEKESTQKKPAAAAAAVKTKAKKKKGHEEETEPVNPFRQKDDDGDTDGDRSEGGGDILKRPASRNSEGWVNGT